MATKKELEARIAALETELAVLKAQQPIILIMPPLSDVPSPRDHYPFGWPKITCGTTIASADTKFTINGAISA